MQDATQAASPVIARTGLLERSQWRRLGTCPFGIAWRLEPGENLHDVAHWPFRPPYLPDGLHIPVAVEGDDPIGPMMFQSPGTQAPADWSADRRGVLQSPARLRRITGTRMTYPANFAPGSVLRRIAQQTGIRLVPGRVWGISLTAESLDGPLVTLPVPII